MKKFFAMSAAATMLLCSCAKIELAGIRGTAEVDTPMEFTEIDLSDCVNVCFEEGGEIITVETDVNVLPYVEVFESGRVLKIRLDKDLRLKKDGWNNLHISVTVPYKTGVRSVSASGASTFFSELSIGGSDVSVSASGASKVAFPVETSGTFSIGLSGASEFECLDLKADEMVAVLSGASVMKANGTVRQGNLTLSGASAIKGVNYVDKYSLAIDECRGSLSGASSATFYSDGVIDCTLSGASCIYYKGNADTSASDRSDGSFIEKE